MKKSLFDAGALAVVLALFLGTTSALAEPVQVKQVAFPVTLSDGHTYSLAGYLYHHSGHEPRTLQVLLHGATYDHRYWDAPRIDGHAYSYARHMVDEGYAVLALDQLGAGSSDHPDGDFFTLQEAASGLHQVMTSLRAPNNPTHHAFRRLVLVGHSLGSLTAVYAEGAYGDADALVLTGLALTPHPPPVSAAVIGPLLQTPYVVFPPALRTQLFYYAPSADPAVVAYDNAVLRDGVPRGEFLSGLQLSSDPTQLGADLITEPVLVQLGADDVTAPAALAPTEAAYYSMAASVTVQALPAIGHAVNLHVDNEHGWDLIEDWIGEHSCDD